MFHHHRKALVIWLSATSIVAAGPPSRSHWHYPYCPDGVCTPRRQTYGHYATKWSRWPGVSDEDYQSRIPEPEPPTSTVPEGTPPEEMPENFLLPDVDVPTLGDDAAPRPPVDAKSGPQPLTEPTERPDLLTDPEEDVMDELLDAPSTPTDDAPAPPFDTTPSPDVQPQPGTREPSTDPTPTPGTDSDLPFDDDPFKDDPLFDDSAPTPPSNGKQSRFDGPSNDLEFPAKSAEPMRLPAAARGRSLPQPQFAPPQASKPLASVGQAAGNSIRDAEPPQRRLSLHASSHNPLRTGAVSSRDVEPSMVVPTAGWEAEPTSKPVESAAWRANPLRAR